VRATAKAIKAGWALRRLLKNSFHCTPRNARYRAAMVISQGMRYRINKRRINTLFLPQAGVTSVPGCACTWYSRGMGTPARKERTSFGGLGQEAQQRGWFFGLHPVKRGLYLVGSHGHAPPWGKVDRGVVNYMYATPSYSFDWIRNADELEQVAALLSKEPIISVDTETSGWQTGNEQLCLIQIGVPTTKRVFLVDVLSTGAPLPLAPLFASPEQVFVAHNASFEERQLARYDMKVKGVRDTLSMSRELRPDLPNHTLRTCCKLLLGKELRKEEQTSDWSLRPLSDSQVDYARLDAEVALDLYSYLANLEQRVLSELELGVPELMSEFAQVTRKRYELVSSIAHELAFLTAREEKLKETIRSKLIDGAPPFSGRVGSCSIQKVRKTEVNTQRVRELYPEFAAEVIREYVDRKQFEIVSRERGLPKNAIEQVLDTVGYNDRMTLKLNDDVGESE
jgi:DNA polymerase III epsilon subunit-like protein